MRPENREFSNTLYNCTQKLYYKFTCKKPMQVNEMQMQSTMQALNNLVFYSHRIYIPK